MATYEYIKMDIENVINTMRSCATAHAKGDLKMMWACGCDVINKGEAEYTRWCVEQVEFLTKLYNSMETGVEEL